MSVWFTSDHHFGHARVITLCSRPFASVDEMDAEMIRRWNAVVAPDDVVYHLGDFAFADHTPYLRALAGEKRLILGNHDHSRRLKVAEGWSSVDSLLHVTVDDADIVLCHYGMRVWRRSHHGVLHFYGHSHGNLPGDSQSTDVGVDCWSFAPVSLGEIRQRLATLPRRVEPDHHAPRDRAGAAADRD